VSTTIIAEKIITFYSLVCDADGCTAHVDCQTEDQEGIVPPDGWLGDGAAVFQNHNDHIGPLPDKRLFIEESCYCPSHTFDCAVCDLRHGGEVCVCHACQYTGVITIDMEGCVEDENGKVLLVGAPCPYLAEPWHSVTPTMTDKKATP
jgi:hypothetical protein